MVIEKPPEMFYQLRVHSDKKENYDAFNSLKLPPFEKGRLFKKY